MTDLSVQNGNRFPPLVRYDAMCGAIEAAYRVDEVKDIRDKAIAWEVYSRQARNTEAERQACLVRLRAERKAGELLRDMEKAKGAAEPGTNRGTTPSHDVRASPTRSELGVSYKQSSDWQRLAKVPQDEFEAALNGAEKPSTAGIIRDAMPPDPERVPVSSEALWLWGRLLDFERNGLLGLDPADVLLTMTPVLLDDVHRLAPRVAKWLQRIGATNG